MKSIEERLKLQIGELIVTLHTQALEIEQLKEALAKKEINEE